MAFCLDNIVWSLTCLLFTISLCNATIQSVTTKFTEKKSVTTSYATLNTVSKIKCVERCNQDRKNGRCSLAGYNKATKTCYLSDDDPLNALDTDDEMAGVFFYEQDLTGIFQMSFLSIYNIFVISWTANYLAIGTILEINMTKNVLVLSI